MHGSVEGVPGNWHSYSYWGGALVRLGGIDLTVHPFRVIKQQFGYAKVRYRGLAKNTARLTMLFALSNLWMARRQLLSSQG
jgi:IS5 family transposase